MTKKVLVTVGALIALTAGGLLPLETAAAGFTDMMNPSRWFGGGHDDDYGPGPGYGPPYGGPGYGPPPYGMPPYGAPGYGAPGYGAPGYGYPAYGVPPGYAAGARGLAPARTPAPAKQEQPKSRSDVASSHRSGTDASSRSHGGGTIGDGDLPEYRPRSDLGPGSSYPGGSQPRSSVDYGGGSGWDSLPPYQGSKRSGAGSDYQSGTRYGQGQGYGGATTPRYASPSPSGTGPAGPAAGSASAVAPEADLGVRKNPGGRAAEYRDYH